MSKMVRMLLATLLGGALLFGAVFGAANTLGIGGVDNLGANSADIGSPPAVIDVTYDLLDTDYTLVDKVIITFASALPVSSWVYVELTDIVGDVIAGATGSAHVDPASEEVTVDVGNTPAEDVYDINITVTVNL